MSVQTSYNDAPAALFPGQLADGATIRSEGTRSFVAETNVVCGRGVVVGAANTSHHSAEPFQVKAPVAGSVLADFKGVLVRHEGARDLNRGVGVQSVGHFADEMTSVLIKRGDGQRIGVLITEAGVTAGDAVEMCVAPSGTLVEGDFHNANIATKTIAITGATWVFTASVGDVGVIEL